MKVLKIKNNEYGYAVICSNSKSSVFQILLGWEKKKVYLVNNHVCVYFLYVWKHSQQPDR